VVASELPGYANVARAGRDALLFPPGDATALAAALVTALTDRERRDALVASGAQRAAEFSIDRLAAVYLDLYDRVLARVRGTVR